MSNQPQPEPQPQPQLQPEPQPQPQTQLQPEPQSQVQPEPQSQPQPNNPLHGVTLEKMLEFLVEKYGWEELGMMIDVRCFNFEPSISSSLKFLRKTQWARTKVENLYLRSLR